MTSKATMSLPSEATDPTLNSKDNIFLSHSGVQKPFVEQLCKDLVESCYFPFFDQRDDSLPKGQEFPTLIFNAARQCRVGVVVLSKEFLTSKWPMHELVAFVNAKESDNKSLNLLPLFFKLSTADLSDECISSRWMGEWSKLAEKDPKVDVEKWKKAVQELRAVNGLEFAKSGNSEVSYREAVVKAIFNLVPPDLEHSTSEVQGRERICKILSEMFVKCTSSGDSESPQPQRLGLYGMGGLGKTTMCKALCNQFLPEFCGRVCHVELGSELSLVLQKKLLKNLLRVGEDVLQRITDTSQGRKCLKENMRRQPVFLVIDNVGDEEARRSEARAYLDAGFHPDSKIMVTARSRKVVEALLRDPDCCNPFPDLMKNEAAVVFLRIAAPGKEFDSLKPEERRIVDRCLKQCRFSPVGQDDPLALKKDRQYHPLVLGALGVYFHDIDSCNLLNWEKCINDFDNLKLSRESSEIFRILGLQFGTFDTATKLIFLDVALYAHGRIRRELNSLKDWVDWLAALHNETDNFVKHKLSRLERNAMINEGESAFTTHDLYKEYAEWYVTVGGAAEDWCVYQKHAKDLPRKLKSTPSGCCWPNMVRISMKIRGLKCVKVPSKKVQEWRNISLLQLHSCINLTDMDLQGFSCLCHLELVGLKKLETLTFSDGDDAQYPFDLQFVILEELKALKHLPNFSFCTKLRLFVMEGCESLTEPPNLESCSALELLRAVWNLTQLRTTNLSGMTSLRDLSIVGREFGYEPIQLEGLSSLINLERLNLDGLPITRLPGLEMLTELRDLAVWRCYFLTELPDLRGLTNLETLTVANNFYVKEIHGVDKLLQLRSLDCHRCRALEWLPDVDQLPCLRRVNISWCTRLTNPPRVPEDSDVSTILVMLPMEDDLKKIVSKMPAGNFWIKHYDL